MVKCICRLMTVVVFMSLLTFHSCTSDSKLEPPVGGDENLVDEITWTVTQGKDQVVLLVKRDTYSGLAAELTQYKADVEANFNVQLNILQGSWTTALQVRETIKKIYTEKGLHGVVLVGNMPMHKFYMHDQDNPNPLYYEDFDLEFSNDNLARSYKGDPDIKVWVANMRAVAVPAQKGIVELKTFLAKTHKYYMGELSIRHKALFLAGWEWPTDAYKSNDAVAPLFDPTDRVVETHMGGSDPNNESIGGTATNFSKHLENNWTLFYIQIHSFPAGHAFDNGGTRSSADIFNLTTSSLITLNHGCSGANWLGSSPTINLTQAYVFGKGIGQVALGQVRTGMIYGHEKIYEKLCAGDYMGKAYLECKKAGEAKIHAEYPGGKTISGVIMIGNPFIKITAPK